MQPSGSAFDAVPDLTNLLRGKLGGGSMVAITKELGDLTGYWHHAVGYERLIQC